MSSIKQVKVRALIEPRGGSRDARLQYLLAAVVIIWAAAGLGLGGLTLWVAGMVLGAFSCRHSSCRANNRTGCGLVGQGYLGQFLATFKECPPRQKAAGFAIDQVLQKLQQGGGH